MDNVNNAAPQGQAVQTPDVQNTVAPVEQQPQQPSDETSYEAIAAKKGFQSPDDLAKAYANLESRATKSDMSNAELQKLFFEAQQSEPVQQHSLGMQAQPPGQDQALAELDRYLDQKWSTREQALKSEFKQELQKRELNDLLKESPDFAKYTSDVKELKNRYPDMSFKEAYTFAKALKGDLVQEARSEGMKQGAEYIQKQAQAQVAPSMQTRESKRAPVDEILQGAGKRWAADPMGRVNPQARAEREAIERELFGRVLPETL